MISLVKKTLLENGFIDSFESLDINILFLRETLFQIFLNGDLSYVVKVGKSKAIDREYNNIDSVKKFLGKMVPTPLLYKEDSGFKISIYEGVRHVITSPSIIKNNVDVYVRDIEKISSQFLNSINFGPKKFCSIEDAKKINILNINKKYKDEMLNSINNSEELLRRVQKVPQHSDFSLNNIGIKIDRSSLIVFDWEEYSPEQIFGFDIFIFIASYFLFDAKAVHNFFRMGQPDGLRRCVDAYCADGGMTKDDIYKLAPLYLAEFLNLKKSEKYGDEIIELVSNLLDDFLQAVPEAT